MEFKSEFLKKAAMGSPTLEKALTRMGQLLRERRVTSEIAEFDGAGIVLGFDFTARTRDVTAWPMP